MAQVSNMPDGMWKTNAKEALTHLTARYASLSVYADKIREQARLSNSTIPCEILDAYNQAVNDYSSFGRRVFDLLHKNKMVVDQVIYHKGKMALDDKGNVRTIRIDMPARPPTFILTRTQCPGITRIMGTEAVVRGDAEMGIAPLAALGAIAIGPLVSRLIIIGAWGIVGVKLLEGLIMLVRGPIYTPDQVVSAYVKCLDGVTDSVAKTYAALPAVERAKIAAQLQMNCREQAKGEVGSGSGLGMILLGAGVVAVAGYMILGKGGGGGAATGAVT